MLISLVIPVYNEGFRVADNLKLIVDAASHAGHDLELLAIDDGSEDNSCREIEKLAEQDSRVQLISLTRNFGKEAAIYAGLELAKGDAVVVLDADLQHPPRLIPAMIRAWEEGAYIVEAVKQERNDPSWLDRWFAKGFYWLYRILSGFDIRGHSDFKLLDRQIVDVYLALPERYRFFRGLVNWLGIESETLPFEVEERLGSTSRWSKVKLIRYATNNITTFSTIPLLIVTWLGSLTLGTGIVLALITLWQKLAGMSEAGFTTVNLLLIVLGGAVMTSLGIIGHYIGRIYQEIKARPVYVLKPTKRKKPCSSPDL
ncbi:MAG: hypothetical protein VR73_07625 [Gammaproteobacteria bacterium BRH_c0]|nr:MAG: hypothetical protein VR73_07625 [Gammaproteobacteria bacterium BRH_c0]